MMLQAPVDGLHVQTDTQNKYTNIYIKKEIQ